MSGQKNLESRLFFEGTVTATDMDRATDTREKGRIGITGSAQAYGGSNGRVTSEAIGRDINPLGRGGGAALVGGMMNLGGLAPRLPSGRREADQGNSVNNVCLGCIDVPHDNPRTEDPPIDDNPPFVGPMPPLPPLPWPPPGGIIPEPYGCKRCAQWCTKTRTIYSDYPFAPPVEANWPTHLKPFIICTLEFISIEYYNINEFTVTATTRCQKPTNCHLGDFPEHICCDNKGQFVLGPTIINRGLSDKTWWRAMPFCQKHFKDDLILIEADFARSWRERMNPGGKNNIVVCSIPLLRQP
jgi:hypothetical protein